MKNILYLLEMGCKDPSINTDVKNHRVRVLENIDIMYDGKTYNMFFEFLQGKHWHYRTENKRTGAPLKKPVYTIDLDDGMYLDTQYDIISSYFNDGTPITSSYRNSTFEREFYNMHLEYTRENILKVVNRYKIGAKYTGVVLVKEAALNIILKEGGYRELDIVGKVIASNYGDCFYEIGDTWNEDHKIVRVTKYARDNNGNFATGNSCEVDIVTGKITG